MKLVVLNVLLVSAVALALAAIPVAASEEQEFKAALTGAEEVPRVTTAASGEVEVELRVVGDSATLKFELEVCNIRNVVQAHIHAPAARGVNEAVRVFLFSLAPGQAPVSTVGCVTLSEGTITLGPMVLGGMTRAAFINALVSGNAYVNVHTTANPGGEIRGQLTPDD